MERRFFIALLLSFVVLYAYQALFVPPAPTPTSSESSAPETTSQPPRAEPADQSAPRTADTAAPSDTVIGDSGEREVVVDTTTLQAVLTNRGGRVVRWRLKAYQDRNGNPVDLVPSDIPADQPRPFSLDVEDRAVSRRINTS